MSGRARANGEGSIFPYRSGFAAYVWVVTPSGQRTRKYVYGRTREIIHDKWVRLQGQAKAGPVATSTPTVAEFLTYWLAEVVRPNLKPKTYEKYEAFVRLYIVPGLGPKRLGKLGVRNMRVWLNEVRRTCQCCAQGKDAARPVAARRCCAVGKCCGAVPSGYVVQIARDVLRSALGTAVTEELVARNVAALVKVPTPRRPQRKPWSADEARRFLEAARSASDPLFTAYVLVLVLGLRRGEVLGLSWEDVDLDGGELQVSRQLQRVHGQLLHGAPRRRARPPGSPCRTSASRLRGCGIGSRRWTSWPPVRRGRAMAWCSRPGTAARSSRGTSTAVSRPGARRRVPAASGSTTPGTPARRCSRGWTCTRGRRCSSCGTAGSR